jgi:hypothetical protein
MYSCFYKYEKYSADNYCDRKVRFFPQGTKVPPVVGPQMTSGNLITLYKHLSGCYSTVFK